jgi:hypothetical protein
MTTDYTIWYRNPRQLFLNMLQNPDFATVFDYAPLREYDKDGNRQYKNFMSGNWAWKQAVCKILLTTNEANEKSRISWVPILTTKVLCLFR